MQKQRSKIARYFLQEINPIIRFLIISDTVVIGASGLLGPIFALYIENTIIGGGPAIAGTAAGIFLFSKSILQIPIAHMYDRIKGEKDDYWFMVAATTASSLLPLLYLIINSPLQLYVIQFFLGALAAFIYPSFMAIFTRNIDKGKESLEWGIYYSLIDIGSALLAIVGGYIATTSGFSVLITSVVLLSLIGTALLIPIKPYIK